MASNELVALIGITLTFFVSVANLIYSLRNNRRTMFVNTVTTSRLKWIDSLRDEVSQFIAVTTQLSNSSAGSDDLGALSLQRDTLLHQIVLHLNPLDLEDQRIKVLAENVRSIERQGTAKGELPNALIALRDATGNYLKKEWNRVKKESTGKQP